MGKSKIQNRMCLAFPDPLGVSAKETADGSSQMEALILQLFLCRYGKPVVGGSIGGRHNIRRLWHFNYTYHNSNVLFCGELFRELS